VARKPAERYPNAMALYDALDGVERHAALVRTRAEQEAVAAEWRRRRKRRWLPGVEQRADDGGAVADGRAGRCGPWRRRRDRAAVAGPSKPARGKGWWLWLPGLVLALVAAVCSEFR